MTAVEEVRAQGSWHYSEIAAAMVVDALVELTREVSRLADAIEGDADGAARARALDAWRIGQGKHPND